MAVVKDTSVTLHHRSGSTSYTADLICVWELGLVIPILLSDAEAQEGKVSYTLY